MKLMARFGVRFLCGILSAMLLFSQIAIGAEEVNASNVFRVSGTTILDPSGQPFVAHGTNINGPNSWWERESAQDAGLIADAWKFNIVRVISVYDPVTFMGWEGYQANNDLKQLVEAFTDRGIVVMLEGHDFTSNQPASADDPAYQAYLAFLKQWANDYKDNPYVWINVMNEPGRGTAAQWAELHKAAIETIRSAGYDNVIVIDELVHRSDGEASAILEYGSELLKSDDNLVFSKHNYNDGYGSYEELKEYVKEVKQQNMALILGEFGSQFERNHEYVYFGSTVDSLKVAEEEGIGWLHWAWDGSDGFSLTNHGTAQGGGWEIDRTDGTKPGNLSWFGDKVWNASHGIEQTFDSVDLKVTDILLDADAAYSGGPGRIQIVLTNSGDVPIDEGSGIQVKLSFDGKGVRTLEFNGSLEVNESASLVSEALTPPDGDSFAVEAVIAASTFDDANVDNNSKKAVFRTAGPEELTDLAVSKVEVLPGKEVYDSSEPVMFRATLTNKGSKTYSGDLGGVFYLNGNKVLWTESVFQSWVGDAATLKPGESIAFETEKAFPLSYQGEVAVGFEILPSLEGLLVEGDRSDNRLFATISVTSNEKRVNAIKNGSFELDNEEWQSWGNDEITEELAHVHHGSKALRVKSGNSGGIGQYPQLKPNTTYVMGAWGKASGPFEGTVDVGVKYELPDGSNPHHFLKYDTDQYSYRQVRFTTPTEFTNVTFFVWKAAAEIDFYLDDVQLYEVPNLLKNAGFEGGMEEWQSWGNDEVTAKGEHVHGGQNALQIKAGGQGGAGAYPPLEPNTTYLLEAWGKSSESNAVVEARIKYELPDGSTPHYKLSFSGKEFEKQEVIFTTPTEFANATLFIWKAQENIDFYMDDFLLTEIPNVLKNSGFENGNEEWQSWGNDVVTSEGARSGNQALLIQSGNVGGAGQYPSLQPNTEYLLTAWGKVDRETESPPEIGIKYLLPDGTNPHHVLKFDETGYDKQQIRFATPEEFNETTLFIWKNDKEAALFLDDLSLVELPSLLYQSDNEDKGITRAEFIQLLLDGLNLMRDQADADLVDVPENHKHYKALSVAKLSRIVSGYSDGSIRPDALIVREEMAAMAARAVRAAGVPLEGSNTQLSYKDAAKISKFAAKELAGLRAAGVSIGNEDWLEPQKTVGQDEAAELIEQIKQLIPQQHE